MNLKTVFQRMLGLPHKKVRTEHELTFDELLANTQKSIINAKKLALRLPGTDYYKINVFSDVKNVGTIITCLSDLLTAMGSTGNEKYIDIPSFNEDFVNRRMTSLDLFLVDYERQWIRLPNALETIEHQLIQLAEAIDKVDPKMSDYYRGHCGRILSRTYYIFNQL